MPRGRPNLPPNVQLSRAVEAVEAAAFQRGAESVRCQVEQAILSCADIEELLSDLNAICNPENLAVATAEAKDRP